MISTCLIVKDEADYLPTCLESLKGADEIVVVDTGSTDNTRQVASTYTDKVFDYDWQDDFSAARNYAKSKATGDWIYSIDADHINETPMDEIRAEVDRIGDKHSVAFIRLNDHHDAAWLFRNDPTIQWTGKVHETINLPATVTTSIRQSIRPREAHTERNLRILKQSPDTPRTRFYTGREYFDLGNYAEAVHHLTRYLEAPAFPAEQAEAWLTIAKAEWLQHHGDKARAACLQAIGTNPDFTEALSFMAEMTFQPLSAKWKRLAEQSTGHDVLFSR